MNYDEKLIGILVENGYYNIRQLPDGFIGMHRMIYTWAVCLDLHEYGYEGRYCYGTEAEAFACCMNMTSIKDAPLPGYKAIK